VLDVKIRKRVARPKNAPKRKWWDLKGPKQVTLKKVKLEVWREDKEANEMWLDMASSIKRVARDVLGESKGQGPPTKEKWWGKAVAKGGEEHFGIRNCLGVILTRLMSNTNWLKRRQRKRLAKQEQRHLIGCMRSLEQKKEKRIFIG
jgi:hypothetical protein